MRVVFSLLMFASFVSAQNSTQAPTQDPPKKKAPKGGSAKTVEQLAEEVKPSVAVILFTGRDGKQQGLGSGFVVRKDGLIATNYHVIGEARPIKVQFSDGKKYDVTAIHASDRSLDLAVLQIDAKDLPVLPLGDASKIKNGQPIVALGHPRGLQYSVVSGVLSGRREVEGMSMLQLAVPIEQGNSGGPVLDMDGKVLGLVTMKSLVTNNLGFAVPINSLKPLLDRPNTIPMDRWLTVGQLDKSEWKSLYGGRWRQRSGRIIADGTGGGFGGRTICLYQREVPKQPYEVTVTVKLDDESGAAGLLFGGDGDDRHYGFYPTGGKLRVTRFQGPDVFSWKILEEIPTPHYQPGEWNTLKVRVEKDQFYCYLNDHLVGKYENAEYFGDNVGLTKFRQTVAEYKKFQVGKQVAGSKIDEKTAARIDVAIAKLPAEKEFSSKQVDPLVELSPGSVAALRDRARMLEKQAEQLRKVASAVHHQKTLQELTRVLEGDDKKIDLAKAALLVSKLDNEELDVDEYRREIDRMAREIGSHLPKDADARAKLEGINKYLFAERGFHGSRVEYYNRSNSYLNEVIDDREGLPITLSVLYMEIAHRLGLNIAGLAFPGHFMVRLESVKGDGQIIDVYEGGKFLSLEQAEAKVLKVTGEELNPRFLKPVGKAAIVSRMLHNLLNVAQNEEDRDGMLRYLDGIVAINPQAHEERWVRAVFRFQAGRRNGSLEDVDYLLDHAPADVDLNRVRELKRLLTK